MRRTAFVALLACAASGCWTFSESAYPEVAVSAAKGEAEKLMLAVNGFDATFTDYESIYGYSTVYVPGYVGWRHYRPGYYETVHTHTLVPQSRTTDMYRRRAREALEDAGFTLASGATVPDRTIEASFGGPLEANGDACSGFAWKLLTAFLCDFDAVTWTAKLRIRDNRTGKLLFHREYVQRYETKVIGVVPIFSILSCDKTTSSYEQSWCLAALTDRIVADVSAFLQQ